MTRAIHWRKPRKGEPDMGKIGVGIIGTGWVAGEHLRAWRANPHAEVRAICDLDPERARAFAAENRLECAIADTWEGLVARDDVQAVSITSPPNCHKTQAVAAARAGKHMLLEKAMATTVEDARAIRDAVAAAGVKSVVGFVLRWNPLFELIRAQLADNTVGRVYYGEVDYWHGIGPWYKQYGWNVKKDVGVSSLLSAGLHAMDGLRWFMGGKVVEVTQYATDICGPEFKEYEYPPTTVTICRFDDGRIGKVVSGIACRQPYVFNINLVGEHGTIRNNQVYSTLKYPGQTSWATVPTILPDSGDVSHHPFTGEVAHLVECIQTGKESHANAADAFLTHEVCFAADLSGQIGKAVALPMA
jgi:predicted dehydrogenase